MLHQANPNEQNTTEPREVICDLGTKVCCLKRMAKCPKLT